MTPARKLATNVIKLKSMALRMGGCAPALVTEPPGADGDEFGPLLPASATMAAMTTPEALMAAATIWTR
jgi:hypothetical protein